MIGAMTRNSLLAVAMLATLASPAAAQDLFLARLPDDKSNPVVDNVTRLTTRPGYDSQPSFVDSNVILYTSFDGDAPADIWRYDIAKKTSVALTSTKPESEYSARVLPNGRISVVMVEKD